MKLTYWHAECLNDHQAYDIRERRKKDAKAALARGGEYGPSRKATVEYGPLRKVTVEYADAFDLLSECLCEGGRYWEAS